MSWLSDIFAGSAKGLIGSVGSIVDDLHLSGEEKQQFKLQMEALVQQRDSEIEQTTRIELQAKERVLVAELQQGDKFTKRARPTVVYAGLAFIGINYVVVPIVGVLNGVTVAPIELPTEFWAGWSGIVATWSIGRSFEKRGTQNRVTSAITGSLLLKD